MRILCVGGGSGGHITPIVAVVKKIQRSAKVRVWCDRRFSSQTRKLLSGFPVRVDVIVSGKWRRYANLSLWQKLRYHIFRTYLRNFLDLFKIAFGFIQSLVKLIIWRPNVIFLNGGFVCLPVGVAAHILRIPIVIHDGDTTPGLANRILARFAAVIGTGSPIKNYPNYPKKITKFIGVPTRDEMREFSSSEQKSAKEKLGFSASKKLIFITGGGQGAVALNEVVVKAALQIIKNDTQILLLAGKNNSRKIEVPKSQKDSFKVKEFLTDDYITAVAAADIVITRAGATTIAELAIAKKPVIIVPNSHLAGDHQTKNAVIYADADAAIVLSQDEISNHPKVLEDAVIDLLNDQDRRKKLSQNLAKFAKPNALDEIVEMILSTGGMKI